jgi:hypothetical protein
VDGAAAVRFPISVGDGDVHVVEVEVPQPPVSLSTTVK